MSTKVEKTQKQKDTMYYVHSIIGLVIMFGFGFLPPFSTITPLGMDMLGILLGLIYLWSMVDMGWPSLAALIAYLLTGATTMKEIMATGFGNNSVMISVFATAFTFAVASSGIFDILAKWILTRKIFQGKPWVLTFALIGMVFLLNACYAGVAVLFLVWALLPKIGEICGLEKQHPWYALVVVGTVFALCMAECIFPFRPMALVMIGFGAPLGVTEMPFIPFIVYTTLIVVVITVISIALLKFILRVDLSKMKNVDLSEMLDSSQKLTKHQKVCAILLVLFILSMILVGSSSLLPDSVIKAKLSSLTIVGVSFIFFAIAMIYRVDGKPLLDMKAVAKDVPWDIVLLLSVVFTFCSSMAKPETGLTSFFATITAPLLGGHSSFIFMLIMFTVTVIATNFLNNTVVIMIMVNISAGYVLNMGLNPYMIIIIFMITAQVAFLLPASSIWGSFCHSQSEMCGKVNIYKTAAMFAIGTILSLFIIIPLGNMIF